MKSSNEKPMYLNEKAVSSIVGIILLVAITVILAPVVGMFVFSTGPVQGCFKSF
jgi:flagellin-like protein